MSSRLHLPIFSLIIAITTTLLLINQRQTHGQNVGRSHQSNQLYREEFETYETLQRNQNPPQQSAIRQEQGEGPLRTRYVEFAETEFKRPSVYWPVPFLSPFNNRVQTIPARTLSQLIRQHIAHNRMKQLALQNLANPILQGVSQITELRQTPFRRWPTSSPKNQNYQEKRRQWKAELNRRLNGQKVPARVIPPLLISGGGQSSIQTDREPDDRYFVTYSPRTRIYQVSRRPPPFLYTTNRDILPEQLDNQPEVPITAEPVAEKKRKMSEGKPRTQTTAIRTTTTTTASPSFAPSTEATTTTTSSTSTSTTTTTAPPTSTEIPILVILQEAEPIVGRVKEQKQIFPALVKPALSTNTQAKQILFLDDYEQPQDEDDEWEPREDRGQPTPTTTTSAPRTVSSISIQTQTSPIIYSSRPKVERTKELEDAREKLRQQLFQPREEDDDDNFVEEEDGDEDLFFFKPGGLAGREGEPFRILVHDQGRKKL